MTIVPSRREFLKAGGALMIVAAAPSAFGQTALPAMLQAAARSRIMRSTHSSPYTAMDH